jgi:hypothetical protein
MIKVTIYNNSGKVKTLTGVIGSRAGENAIQFIYYTNNTVLVPLHNVEAIEIENLTDEQILASDDVGYVEWFKRILARQQESAEKEVEELKEAGVSLQ